MDLRQFFKKIREVEASLVEHFPLVSSLETGDGGKPGVLSEVPRCQAARMIVEGKARLASEEEKQVYIEQTAASRKYIDELESAKRLHVALLGPRSAATSDASKSTEEVGVYAFIQRPRADRNRRVRDLRI